MKVVKKILRFIKKIIYKLCGKARWLILGFVLIYGLQWVLQMNFSIGSRFNGVLDENSEVLYETPIRDLMDFSINRSGRAAVSCNIGYDGMDAIVDAETGQTVCADVSITTTDMWKDDYFRPYKYAYTDDNVIYAVRSYYNDNQGDRLFKKECIVRLTEELDYIDEIFTIDYSDNDNRNVSKVSRLHYYNGQVTFAVVEPDNVVEYSIDTSTKVVSKSREYTTDENGTYTISVIPVDDGFIFKKSDGEVYLSAFDEPLGDAIYHFDNTDEAPYFTGAVQVDGDLYIFNRNQGSKVYILRDGKAEEAFDINDVDGHLNSKIAIIETYHSEQLGKDVLAVCLEDGLLVYADGEIIDKNIVVKTTPGFLYYVRRLFEILADICVYAFIINLIIRRKTLFYKLMLATVPIFTIVTIIIAVNLYDYFDEQNTQVTRSEIEMISEFGTKELRGYDFSGLFEINEDTGAEERRLYDKLMEINDDYAKKWSEKYVFSVLYRTGDYTAAVLANDNKLTPPMCTNDAIYSEEDFKKYDETGDYYVSQMIKGFYDFDSGESEIVAFGRVADAGESGQVYFKVSTLSRNFWTARRDLMLDIIFYSALVILLLMFIMLLTSIYITRAARKATNAVKRIAEGDLSARIKYKSKDELGEICTQVNTMGKNLEELFEEKDRTEQFYYKFVPEQFRKLLGKDSFTDLALGDSCSRDITVLFFDIRSFSINSETMTAKENFEFVNAIYGMAGPIIRENGGFVDKYIGDAVMALFENADDAVKSGIEIYRAIVLSPNKDERLGLSDINIGIGIHSGMASIGIVGETERLSGTVISDTVNLSSRLEGLTKQYKTALIVSKDTVDRMSDPDSLDLRYLGIVQVAGVNEAKPIYEVLDCLPNEEREKRHENRIVFREAVRRFHLGRRDETLEILQGLVDAGKSDYVVEKYLEYINNLPPEDEGNVFRFVRK